MNKGYGEGGGFFGKKTKRDLAKKVFLKNQEQNEAMAESSAKRTPEIPGKDDGASFEPDQRANVKFEGSPFSDDSTNRTLDDSGEIIDP